MRLQLNLRPLRYPAAVPLDQHPLSACLYEAWSLVSPELARHWHDVGVPSENKADKQFKFFVFAAPELPRFDFAAGERVFYNGSIQWQIGSPINELIESLLAGLGMQPQIRLGRSFYHLEKASLIPPPPLLDEARFIALSPITVARTETDLSGKRVKRYIRADDPLFAELVRENLYEKYRALTGAEPQAGEFAFEWDWDYVKRAGGVESRKVTRLVSYKRTQIKGYQMPFYVRGNPDLIRLGWESGFGSANSQGFGLAGIA